MLTITITSDDRETKLITVHPKAPALSQDDLEIIMTAVEEAACKECDQLFAI